MPDEIVTLPKSSSQPSSKQNLFFSKLSTSKKKKTTFRTNDPQRKRLCLCSRCRVHKMRESAIHMPLWKPITTLIKATMRRRRMTLKTTMVVRNYLELIAKMKKSYEIKKKRPLLEFVGFWLWIHFAVLQFDFLSQDEMPFFKISWKRNKVVELTFLSA